MKSRRARKHGNMFLLAGSKSGCIVDHLNSLVQGHALRLTNHAPSTQMIGGPLGRVVLALYRKREPASCTREHGWVARFRYSDLKEAAWVAADAGVMQIQLRESRFGVGPGGMREGKAPNREKRRVAESASVVR